MTQPRSFRVHPHQLAALLVSTTTLLCAQIAKPIPANVGATRADEKVVQLDNFAVTAEREPGNVVLGLDDIGRTHANDLGQLLAYESTLAVGGGSPQAQKIYVRGFEDVLLNVTLDGAPQAGELYHHQSRVQLEPEFIRSIQLDAGAGAATAGAGALTGALAVTTKDAFEMLESGQRAGLFSRFAAAFNGKDSQKYVGAVYGKLNDHIGAIAAYNRQIGDHYEDGRGNVVRPTAFNHERSYTKISARYGAHEADLAYEQVHDTGTYFERPNFVNFTGTYILSDHDLERRTITYNHRYNSTSDLTDLRGTLYWTENTFENHRNSTGTLYGAGDFKSAGFDLRNTSKWSNHATTYGIEYRADDLFGRQQATPPAFWGSSWQSASMLGLYAQNNWDVTERVRLSGGIRYDVYRHRVDVGVGAGAENNDEGFSPNASVEWQLLDGLNARVSYAQSFRGITIREAFFSALYVHQGNLKPEHADNLEFGLAYEKNGYFARATFYRQNIEDYVNAVYVGTPVWGYWRNTGNAQVEGYEFEAGRRWQIINAAVGVWEADNTFNNRALNDSDLGLGTRIGRTWTARVDWALPTRHSEISFRSRYVESEANSISTTAPAKPAYAVADIHLNTHPFGNPHVTLSLSVNNAFDRFYYDHSTYSFHAGTGKYIGFPDKGREFVLSAAYKF
jgi:hemoglobin/transferrin/lactoferrin receptor protein